MPKSPKPSTKKNLVSIGISRTRAQRPGWSKSISRKRREIVWKKREKPRGTVRAKVRPERYIGFHYEVHLKQVNKYWKETHTEVLETVRNTFGLFKIVSDEPTRNGSSSRVRLRIYLTSETDLVMLQMIHKDAIYRVYKLVDEMPARP